MIPLVTIPALLVLALFAAHVFATILSPAFHARMRQRVTHVNAPLVVTHYTGIQAQVQALTDARRWTHDNDALQCQVGTLSEVGRWARLTNMAPASWIETKVHVFRRKVRNMRSRV